MTPSEAFAKQMSRNDRTTLTGKVALFPTLTTTPGVVLTVSPLNLSSRTAALAAIFAEYHINFIRVKFIGSNSGVQTLGFLDDATTAEGDAPVNYGGVLQLRCSSSSFPNSTIPAEFTYTQKASSFWLKTYAGATGSEPRLSIAALCYGAASGTSGTAVEFDFSVTFQGAVDILTT
jgi:hypothetical protein